MAACSKTRYRDKGAALTAIEDLRVKRTLRGEKREGRAYYCRPCRAWHLTSEPRRPA